MVRSQRSSSLARMVSSSIRSGRSRLVARSKSPVHLHWSLILIYTRYPARLDSLRLVDRVLSLPYIGDITLPAGSVQAAALGVDSVTAAKIQDSSVVTSKIVDAAVTTAKVANAAVTSEKLASSLQRTCRSARPALYICGEVDASLIGIFACTYSDVCSRCANRR